MITLIGTARGVSVALALGALMLLGSSESSSAQTPTKPKTVEKTATKPPAPKEQPENKEEAQPEQEAKSPEDAKKAAEKKQVESIAAKKAKALQFLEAGTRALSAGKNEDASKALSQALDTGGLAQNDVAKALYRRGIAHRKLGRASLAIADFTQAMYLTGLSDAERLDARYQRGLAYQSAGLNENAAEDLKAGKPLDPASVATVPPPVEQKAPLPPSSKEPVKEAKPVQPAPESKPIATETTPAPPPTRTASAPNSVSSFFSNLFSSQPKEAQPPPAPRTSTWQQSTEVKLVAADPTAKTNRPAPKPVVVPSATREITTAAIEKDSKVSLQIASLRTEAQAAALVKQVKQSHRDLLAGRDIRIEKSVIGTMGTFYQVRISSFASETDGLSHCGRLRQAGLDCMIVR